MKLSELLIEHPELDVDLGDERGRVFLDGVYLFRVVKMEHKPGQGTMYTRSTEHTDGIVYRGLLESALQISSHSWAEEDDD